MQPQRNGIAINLLCLKLYFSLFFFFCLLAGDKLQFFTLRLRKLFFLYKYCGLIRIAEILLTCVFVPHCGSTLKLRRSKHQSKGNMFYLIYWKNESCSWSSQVCKLFFYNLVITSTFAHKLFCKLHNVLLLVLCSVNCC